jgi:predicted molibdopterin-dependent oxidoreductase YjgC
MLADVQLPAAVYAEKAGTFTNLQGRVQRFCPAVSPIGESLPDLEILSRLFTELGKPLRSNIPEKVFDELSRNITAFAGMTYETLGDFGQLLSE